MKIIKKTIFLFSIFLLYTASIHAQEKVAIQGEKVKDGVIYFTFDGKNLEFFTEAESADSKKNVAESMTFSLKNDNHSNIYLNWINPLKYKYTWNDTTYVDERDIAINDFVDLLVAQFGLPVSSLNKTENAVLVERSKKGNDEESSDKDLVFNSTDLTLLYILLRSNNGKICPGIESSDDDETCQEFNAVTDSLKTLDDLISEDISNKVDLNFSSLLELDDPSNVSGTVDLVESQIKKYEKTFAKIESLLKFIKKEISELTISADALYNNYSKNVISKFIQQSTTTLSSNKNLINKLKPVIQIVKNSVNDESSNSATKGFYRIRKVDFEDGEKLKTTFTINEFEYKKETKDFSKKGEVLKKSIIFQKYDFFAISVSSGLFYSSTTLKGFGVSNSTGDEFTVTEDDISKSSPVTAVFLNLNLSIDSRYVAPLTQLGIDPTKKQPFLLYGLGFSIPSARIAFSGGWVWTWNQSLDKLSVGQTISSTTELEKDMKYEFDVKPKGYYFGIQYNF